MPPDDAKIRLFIAAQVPAPAKAILTGAIECLEAALPNQVRWIRPETVHLTLKFLGDVPASRTASILSAMDQAAREFDGGLFRIGLAGLGMFQSRGRARVIWGGVQGATEKLEKLHDYLDAALENAGFTPDQPPYRPHLTLGRPRNHRVGLEASTLAAVLEGWEPPAPAEWTVDGMHLIHSILGQGPPRYVNLGSAPLTERPDG